MKNIKQIREEFDLITEKEENEAKKLSALVRAGLYDAKKLPALKKALDKSADKMTAQEKRMLLNLLDSLISQVTSDDQVYRKVRQNVQHVNEAKKEDTYSKLDTRVKQGFPSDKDIPSVLILKRKAIRVYPDNQKVALYYSQAIDKYVTIPFSDIQTGLNEEEQLEEKLNLGQALVGIASGIATKGGEILSKGKEFGKKAIDSWKKSRADRAKKAKDAARRKDVKDLTKQRRGSGPRNRGRGRDRDRDLGLDGALGVGLGGGGGGAAGQASSQMPNYQFSGKVQGKSSWEGEQRAAASRSATQDARMRRLSTQAMQREDVISSLKEMVDNDIKEKTVFINEQEININNTIAKKILFVYESINIKNKKKMEKMLNESATSFNKVLTFALRQ
jgi:hypothetical protein